MVSRWIQQTWFLKKAMNGDQYGSQNDARTGCHEFSDRLARVHRKKFPLFTIEATVWHEFSDRFAQVAIFPITWFDYVQILSKRLWAIADGQQMHRDSTSYRKDIERQSALTDDNCKSQIANGKSKPMTLTTNENRRKFLCKRTTLSRN
jgi:hypothetical protein